MKKKLITLCFLVSFSASNAANFNVVINNNDSYFHGVFEVTTSEWNTVSKSNCNKDLLPEDFYYDVEFLQTETCLEEQERTVTNKVTYKDGREDILSVKKEIQSITISNAQVLKGIHIENTCNDILLNNFSLGDGNYRISFNGGSDVYCDMTRNGGGWMRLSNYDWNEDSYNTPATLLRTENRTITAYTGIKHTFTDGWFNRDVSLTEIANNPSAFYWTEAVVDTNGFAWTQSMIDIVPLFEISIDSYTVATTSKDTTTVNGQYVDGISITYGTQGSRKHIHTLSVSTSNIGRTGLEWLVNSGQHTEANGTNVTILSDIKPSGTERISARLMANQDYTDEKVGIRKFKVWVK